MKKHILSFLFCCFFSLQLLHGQVGDGCQGFLDGCFQSTCSGVVLNAIGGVQSESNVICNGQVVTFINTSTPANLIDSTVISWGDDNVDTVAGLQSVQHVYNIQPDTCWDGMVCISWGVKYHCSNGYNFTCVQTQMPIITDPLPAFVYSPDPICEGNTAPVQFTNTSCIQPFATTSFYWDFGDGDTSTVVNPSHNFPGVGCYQVSMTVSVYVPGSSDACLSRTATRQVCVLASPVAQAAFDMVPGTPLCAPMTLKIINLSQHVDSYKWTTSSAFGVSFVDNTNQFSPQPHILFTQPGTFTLQLLGEGCGESVWDTVITVVKAPGVTLDEIDDGCQTLTLVPATLSNYSPAPQPLADYVSWTFFGGSPSNASGHYPSGTVSFDTPGDPLFAAVRIENVCGISSDTQWFDVNLPVALTLEPLPPLCHSAEPVPLLANVDASWSGPGVLNGSQFDPSLVPPGSTVTLTASYGQGLCAVSESMPVTVMGMSLNAGADQSVCGVNAPAFTLPAPNEPGGFYVVNGTNTLPGDVFNPTDFGVGAHVVAYFLADADGCLNSDELTVTVWGLPSAMPSVPFGGCVGEVLNFSVPSAGLCSAAWVFENGTETGLNVSHSFSEIGSQAVTLIVESCDGGCADTAIASLLISQPPTGVDFVALTAVEGCGETLAVTFQNLSAALDNPGDVSYRWTSNAPGYELSVGYDPPAYLFPQNDNEDAIYWVKLEVENGCGVLSKTIEVIVHPVPKAVVGLPVNSSCSPMLLENYAVIVTGKPTTFSWWLDGVQISDDSLLQSLTLYAYPSLPRTYELIFKAANDCGADSVSQTIIVSPVDYAAFVNQDTNQVCLGFDTLHFISYPPPGCWSWWKHQGSLLLWGGDTLLFQPSQPGADSLVLYVSNGCGYDSLVVNFTAHDAPETSLTALPFNCEGTPFVIVNNSPSAVPTAVVWGDASLPFNPLALQHTYAEPGWYWVEVTLRDTLTFCYARDSVQVEVRPLPVPSLAASNTSGCPPLTVHFQNNSVGACCFTWHFGTGDTSHQPNPVYSYDSTGIFSVLLLAEDALGCSADTVFNAMVVHPVPVPDFEMILEDTCGLPVEVQVENYSQGGLGFAFQTDIGATSQATNPAFTFTTPGDHWVQEVVTNQFQCADTLLKSFRTYHQPVADFVADPETCENVEAHFFNHSQHADSFLYHFGDGTSSTLAEPRHIYPAGIYSPALVAGNEGVCFDTLTLQDLISVKPAPDGGFSWFEKTDPRPAGIIVFENESEGATNFLWHFGDGDSTNVLHPEHRYEGNGDKIVTLVAYNEWGCVDTAVQFVPLTRFFGLYVPDALAPESGEGESRLFLPKGVGLTEYQISVFSAQGELLWQSSLLDGEGQPAEAWDGSFRGETMSQGAYAWLVEAAFLDGKKVRREGSVTVLR